MFKKVFSIFLLESIEILVIRAYISSNLDKVLILDGDVEEVGVAVV